MPGTRVMRPVFKNSKYVDPTQDPTRFVQPSDYSTGAYNPLSWLGAASHNAGALGVNTMGIAKAVADKTKRQTEQQIGGAADAAKRANDQYIKNYQNQQNSSSFDLPSSMSGLEKTKQALFKWLYNSKLVGK